jgi:DNA-directed RNA polymerase specialized sigma24 family protein
MSLGPRSGQILRIPFVVGPVLARRPVRRVLGNHQDTEDVAQATFLVLARRAKSLRRDGTIGGWLSPEAVNAALKLRASRLENTCGLSRVA